MVRSAAKSLDICLSDPPLQLAAPVAASQAMATQTLIALANGTSPTEIAETLHQPPPAPPEQATGWNLPGWLLIVVGFAARTYRA